MDQSPTFARHFSRLVWLLTNESGSVDEQKMSLRALVQASRVSPVALAVENWQLQAGDLLIPSVLTGVKDTVGRMVAHSVREIRVESNTGAAEILGLARIIAADAAPNDGGARVLEKLALLGAAAISVTTIPAAPQGPGAGAAPPEPVALDAPSPAAADAALPAAAEPPPVAPPAPVEPAPVEPAPAEPAPPAPVAPAPSAPSAASDAAGPPAPAAPSGRPVSEATAALMAQLAGREVSTLPPEELLAAFDSAEQHGDVASANKLLDDLATLAEHSARVGRPRAVADILHGLVTREARTSDEEVKQTFLLVIRRLSRPALMRGVAGLIAKHPERKQHCYEVLLRTGEDGAEAVIEQVGQSRSMEERQSMLDVLVELPDAVPALIRMLGDARWFVVRNAADLLGELAATRAESALVALLKHADDRVRRSATNALLKLGTTGAVKGVYDAVGDSSPEVRMQVAASIASRKDAKTSVTLIKAIDGEEDGEVQLALIAALGKVATPDAVQKLVKMAEPAGGIFKKKDATLRVAAVQALVEARTPAALAALKELAADKEREVRETATRALAQLGQ